MDTSSVKVHRVDITREEIDLEHKTAGAEVAAALAEVVGLASPGRGAGFRLPMAKEKLTVELHGVPAAVANALRRTLKDELRGRCLTFDGGDLDREASTDPFMADDDFVRTRVRMIRLRPQISEVVVKGLRFALDAENKTATVMSVYSGDLVIVEGSLTEPLFNPTYEIASLQPGKTLRINNIRIAEGFGNQDAAFMVAVRGVSRPLDIAKLSHAETHVPGGGATQQSGYAVSSLVANARKHLVTAILPAVPAGRGATAMVILDACGLIMKRLRYIQGVLEGARIRAAQRAGASTHRSANAFFLVTPDGPNTKGVLGVRNETDTIGNLIARSVYELMPDIGFVAYTCVPHEKMMRLTVSHAVSEPSEIELIVTRAVKHAYAIFSQIQQGVRALT
jgi:DNA-directed RNA polymerase subunit L